MLWLPVPVLREPEQPVLRGLLEQEPVRSVQPELQGPLGQVRARALPVLPEPVKVQGASGLQPVASSPVRSQRQRCQHHRLVLVHLDFNKVSGGRGGNLRVNLVGGYL